VTWQALKSRPGFSPLPHAQMSPTLASSFVPNPWIWEPGRTAVKFAIDPVQNPNLPTDAPVRLNPHQVHIPVISWFVVYRECPPACTIHLKVRPVSSVHPERHFPHLSLLLVSRRLFLSTTSKTSTVSPLIHPCPPFPFPSTSLVQTVTSHRIIYPLPTLSSTF